MLCSAVWERRLRWPGTVCGHSQIMIIGGRGIVIGDVIIIGLIRVMYVVTHVVIRVVRLMNMDLTTVGRPARAATRTAETRVQYALSAYGSPHCLVPTRQEQCETNPSQAYIHVVITKCRL